jgi:hypothetical protein
MVRLSAGRLNMSEQDQALCFLAGANSIFAGEKLLTTGNPEYEKDKHLFEVLGLTARPATPCEGRAMSVAAARPSSMTEEGQPLGAWCRDDLARRPGRS